MFIFPEINQPKEKQPQVVTTSCLLTSDGHVQMYDKKVSKKRQAEEAKQKRKDECEQRKAAKEQQKNKAVESGQEMELEREEPEFEHVVEREIGSTYNQKNHPQKK